MFGRGPTKAACEGGLAVGGRALGCGNGESGWGSQRTGKQCLGRESGCPKAALNNRYAGVEGSLVRLGGFEVCRQGAGNRVSWMLDVGRWTLGCWECLDFDVFGLISSSARLKESRTNFNHWRRSSCFC